MQSHQRLLPARGDAFRHRRERRRSRNRLHRQRACAARTARRCRVHLRARRRCRHRRPGRAAERHHVLRGRGSFADKTERLVGLVGAWAVTTSRSPPPGWRRPTRPPSSCVSSSSWKGTSARSTRGSPGSRSLCVAIDEQYLPDAADAPLPQSEAARARRCGQARYADGRVRARHAPTGSRTSYALRRAAIGVCRLALEGGLSFRIDDPTVRDFVEERLESVLDVPVEAVRVARGAGLDDLRSIAELARFLGGLPDDRLGPVHEVRDAREPNRRGQGGRRAGEPDPAARGGGARPRGGARRVRADG